MPSIRLSISIRLWLLAFIVLTPTACAPGVEDVTPSTQTADNESSSPSISADGRYVAFISDASNLVDGDTNGLTDIFVHDLKTHSTTRISVASNGLQTDGASSSPSISADGRYVAFSSEASNLADGDTNGLKDIFVHDLKTHTTTRLSVASNGLQTDGGSYSPSISADGHSVAFASSASNLVSGDSNGLMDIFVRNVQNNTTALVSINSNGTQTNDSSDSPVISADGRYVAFVSLADNLAIEDTDKSFLYDVFVRDLQTNTTTLASINSNGTQANDTYGSDNPVISADGRYVIFVCYADNLASGDTNENTDILMRNLQTGVMTRLSLDSNGTQASDNSFAPAISANGRYVVFISYASNLVNGDTNNVPDIFVHDLQASTTTRVSLDSDGTQADSDSSSPVISADGRYVAFSSSANNLVNGDTNNVPDIFVYDRQSKITTPISVAWNDTQSDSSSSSPTTSMEEGAQTPATQSPILADDTNGSFSPSISANGRYVAFSSDAGNLVNGDINNAQDVFVHDVQIDITTLISLDPNGNQANGNSDVPTIAADGRYVAFMSDASNLVSGDTNGWRDVFVRDLQANTTTRVSLDSRGAQTNGNSDSPSISADGRYVAFMSDASNLVSGDTNGASDIFLHDRQTNTTTLVSVNSDSTRPNGDSSSPALSADGRYLAFVSLADNLVSGDKNESQDIFLRDLQTNTTTLISIGSNSTQANSYSDYPVISSDGHYVAFESSANNLVNGDTNDYTPNVFVRDLQANTTILISINPTSTQTDSYSFFPSISVDGRYVAFEAYVSTLVNEDTTNDYLNVFVYDLKANIFTLVSATSENTQANNYSFSPSISADGRYVAFASQASDLVNGDTNEWSDIFVRDLLTNTTTLISAAWQGQIP